MRQTQQRPEIDYRSMRLIIGLMALSMASLTWIFAPAGLTSISASYWQGGWSQTFFIGFLFAVASFLLAYNGVWAIELPLAKVAAVAAAGIALFPCNCTGANPPYAFLHYVAAAVMFASLGVFSLIFYLRARAKPDKEARIRRATVYAVCTVVIFGAIIALGLHWLLAPKGQPTESTFVFYGEAAALIAFGISWLTASHFLPFVTGEGEMTGPLARH